MLNLATILEDSARQHPDNIAVVFGEMRLSYAQLNGASSQVAAALIAKDIKPGDRVALHCPNLPYFPIVYYGILKAGAVVVPLNVLLKSDEIAYHLADSQAVAYFCFEGTAELPMSQRGYSAFEQVESCHQMIVMPAKPGAPSPIEGVPSLQDFTGDLVPNVRAYATSPTDTAVILYTSGTTGQPKGAELTHCSVFMNTHICRDIFKCNKDDVQMITLPLFHSFGQVVQMNVSVYMASAMVLVPKFDPEVAWQLMEKEAVTIFCGVPTMYWALLHQAQNANVDFEKIAKCLKICASGGAPLPVEIIKDFEARFDVPILEGYGLSETSPVATFSISELPRKVGSVGVPIWGVEIQIVDEKDEEVAQGEVGEIVIRGHNVMKGYFRKPEATEKAMRGGWLHTGDMGRFDEDGYLYIVDRVKDMIIRGGFNVYPRELEETMMQHPAISLVAVIGVPHARHGEEIKAFVVLKDGAEANSEELISWCKDKMAAYKYPRELEIRDSLPTNATGKLLKKELRAEELAKRA